MLILDLRAEQCLCHDNLHNFCRMCRRTCFHLIFITNQWGRFLHKNHSFLFIIHHHSLSSCLFIIDGHSWLFIGSEWASCLNTRWSALFLPSFTILFNIILRKEDRRESSWVHLIIVHFISVGICKYSSAFRSSGRVENPRGYTHKLPSASLWFAADKPTFFKILF